MRTLYLFTRNDGDQRQLDLLVSPSLSCYFLFSSFLFLFCFSLFLTGFACALISSLYSVEIEAVRLAIGNIYIETRYRYDIGLFLLSLSLFCCVCVCVCVCRRVVVFMRLPKLRLRLTFLLWSRWQMTDNYPYAFCWRQLTNKRRQPIYIMCVRCALFSFSLSLRPSPWYLCLCPPMS